MHIHDWIRRTFSGPEPKVFFDLGCHVGQDTKLLATLPKATVYALEPDPRSTPRRLPNVRFHRLAVSDRCGRAPFLLSESAHGRPYPKSSSLKRPKAHLELNPQVSFGEWIEVETTTLDAFAEAHGIGEVSLIWADVQGAEREMIKGGQELLKRTRLLYTEFSDQEEYEGQPTLSEIMAMLPGWRLVRLWPNDVLLERVE